MGRVSNGMRTMNEELKQRYAPQNLECNMQHHGTLNQSDCDWWLSETITASPCHSVYQIFNICSHDYSYSVIVSIGWAHLSEIRAPHLPHLCEYLRKTSRLTVKLTL